MFFLNIPFFFLARYLKFKWSIVMKLRLIVDKKKKKLNYFVFFYKTNIIFDIRINVKVYTFTET